jgi:hypothetical protein
VTQDVRQGRLGRAQLVHEAVLWAQDVAKLRGPAISKDESVQKIIMHTIETDGQAKTISITKRKVYTTWVLHT